MIPVMRARLVNRVSSSSSEFSGDGSGERPRALSAATDEHTRQRLESDELGALMQHRTAEWTSVRSAPLRRDGIDRDRDQCMEAIGRDDYFRFGACDRFGSGLVDGEVRARARNRSLRDARLGDLLCAEAVGSLPPGDEWGSACLLYTSPSPRDLSTSRMPSSA